MERVPDRPWSAYQPSRPYSYHPGSPSNGFHDDRPPSRMSSQGQGQGRLSAPSTPRDSRYSVANHSRQQTNSANQRRASPASRRRSRKCVCGLLLTFTSLLMYFAGGFLLVANRRGVYPVLEKPVDESLVSFFLPLGASLLLTGFLLFIISYALLCANWRCHDDSAPAAAGVRVLPRTQQRAYIH